jgi:DNA-binding SARP family transcriptional activator
MRDGDMVRILGPIDVRTATGTIAVGGHNPRALLGALTISAGHAASIDQLRGTLWGDRPPATADNTLQSHISHLRELLGCNAIIRVDHSYQLVASSEQIDALRFEAFTRAATAERSQPQECRDLCRKGLMLWRGPPFGDLCDELAFRLEANRLEELRLATMELSLECDVALGNHELAVGELENAVTEHPYRERLWYLLIQSLMLDDRRVEALRTCTRLRAVLGEVGLDAGAELRELEQQILDGGVAEVRPPDDSLRSSP